MRISDWSSDVCSSDLPALPCLSHSIHTQCPTQTQMNQALHPSQLGQIHQQLPNHTPSQNKPTRCMGKQFPLPVRSEEHTSELQSLMRISYAVFCLKKKNHKHYHTHVHSTTTKIHHQQTN